MKVTPLKYSCYLPTNTKGTNVQTEQRRAVNKNNYHNYAYYIPFKSAPDDRIDIQMPLKLAQDIYNEALAKNKELGANEQYDKQIELALQTNSKADKDIGDWCCSVYSREVSTLTADFGHDVGNEIFAFKSLLQRAQYDKKTKVDTEKILQKTKQRLERVVNNFQMIADNNLYDKKRTLPEIMDLISPQIKKLCEEKNISFSVDTNILEQYPETTILNQYGWNNTMFLALITALQTMVEFTPKNGEIFLDCALAKNFDNKCIEFNIESDSELLAKYQTNELERALMGSRTDYQAPNFYTVGKMVRNYSNNGATKIETTHKEGKNRTRLSIMWPINNSKIPENLFRDEYILTDPEPCVSEFGDFEDTHKIANDILDTCKTKNALREAYSRVSREAPENFIRWYEKNKHSLEYDHLSLFDSFSHDIPQRSGTSVFDIPLKHVDGDLNDLRSEISDLVKASHGTYRRYDNIVRHGYYDYEVKDSPSQIFESAIADLRKEYKYSDLNITAQNTDLLNAISFNDEIKPNTLYTVFYELVNNAVSSGGENIKVNCEKDSENNRIIFSVEDDGETIPAEIIEKSKQKPHIGSVGYGECNALIPQLKAVHRAHFYWDTQNNKCLKFENTDGNTKRISCAIPIVTNDDLITQAAK